MPPPLRALLACPSHDFEAARYRILAALQRHRAEVRALRLFPSVPLLTQFEGDLARYRGLGDDAPEHAARLSAWAEPYLRSVLREGRETAEAASDWLRLTHLGLAPASAARGVLLTHDAARRCVHRYRFRVIGSDGARRIDTQARACYGIGAGETALYVASHIAQREALGRNRAVYFADAELALPYHATLLPLARRVLAKRLERRVRIA